nr:CRISPR-associated endonuclease Cas1 [Candidatus Sigynarchaeum springense]
MKEILYVTTNKAEIRRDHDCIVCSYPDPEHPDVLAKRSIPIHRLSSIEFYGNVSVTMPVLELCEDLGIPCFFNTYLGNPVGMFIPASGTNPSTRLHQYAVISDPERRLRVAIRIVQKTIRERIRLVRTRFTSNDASMILERMESHVRAAGEARDLNELRGHEGVAMKEFFDCFGSMLKYLPFHHRSRHPPEDESNALLSYGNVLLYNMVNAEVYKSSLDPCAGFLHDVAGPRNSLALDIAEMFRPALVDDLIIVCDHQRIINVGHFDKDEFKCYLSKEGRTKWIGEFKKRSSRLVDYPSLQRPVSMQEQIKLQCYKLIKYLTNEDADYVPIDFNNW